MKIASNQDIKDFVEEAKDVIEDDFERAILYGSYAREEHDTGSDIDIAFIVNGEVDESRVFEIVDRFRKDRSLDFSPRFFEKEEFNSKLREGFRFYKKVDEEGVEI